MRDRREQAKAKQVYLILRDRILTGAIAFDAKLPTENELAEVHGVSPAIIRRALGELARERMIEQRRSAGMRVIFRPTLAAKIADISGTLASFADMGRLTAVKLTSFAHVPVEGTVAQALVVPSDQMLQGSVRVCSVDGEPFSDLTTYAPKSISLTSTQQELASQPLLDLLGRAGVKVEHPRQRVSAELAAPDIRSGSTIARQSRTAGETPSTTRRLITRSKPPDLRAALGEGAHHVGY